MMLTSILFIIRISSLRLPFFFSLQYFIIICVSHMESRLVQIATKINTYCHLHTLLHNSPLFQPICPGCLWARDNRWLLSRVQSLAGPAGETGAFCPGWRYQPGQKVSLLSRLVAPPGTKGPTLLSRLITPTRTKE